MTRSKVAKFQQKAFFNLSVCLAGFTNLFHHSFPSFSLIFRLYLPLCLSERVHNKSCSHWVKDPPCPSCISLTPPPPPHLYMASPHCRRSARCGCWVWVTGSWGRRYNRPWSPRPRSQTCERWWSSRGCSTRGNLRREEKRREEKTRRDLIRVVHMARFRRMALCELLTIVSFAI